ncbi:MAG: hypothetical protein BWK78_04565 [Thiotrichaceae bacterium IS1]|nr:MAG: hypothetical protein BWK78_04565 [Thiotrichaceae bacterium IS1]
MKLNHFSQKHVGFLSLVCLCSISTISKAEPSENCITSASSGKAVRGEFIVKINACSSNKEEKNRSLRSLRAEMGADVVDQFSDGAEVWSIPPPSLEDTSEPPTLPPEICNKVGLEYAQPNYYLKMESIPNDPDFSNQWGLTQIQADLAWDTRTNSEVIVAVLDSGIDLTHPDLVSNIVSSHSFIDNDTDLTDNIGHGTHCVGIIAATGNNGIGVSGANWSAKIMPLKIFGKDGTSANAKHAIEYAVSNGAKILSNSWGGYFSEPAVEEAIRQAKSQGVLFIASAGNEDKNTDIEPHYPSGYDLDNIIAVMATDRNDQRAIFKLSDGTETASNYGFVSTDLGAPGNDIYSTVPGGYDYKGGTSMAAPYVAGVAALVWAQYPALTYQQVRDRILCSVDKIDALQGKTAMGGRLNAYRALTEPNPCLGRPIAEFSFSGKEGDVSVSLDATASHDTNAEGTITKYRWEITGETATPPEESSVFVTFPGAGIYPVKLIVTDNEGNEAQLIRDIAVPIVLPPSCMTDKECFEIIGSVPFEIEQNIANVIEGIESPDEVSSCRWGVEQRLPYGGTHLIDSSDQCTLSKKIDSEGTYVITSAIITKNGSSKAGKPITVRTLSKLGEGFGGGIAVNGNPYQSQVEQKLSDPVEVTGEINFPQCNHQLVDIVVYADFPTSTETLKFMLDSNGIPQLWDGNPATLVAFKTATLTDKPLLIKMYKGNFVAAGTLKVYFGFRLKKDNTLFLSGVPINIKISE